MINSYVSLQTAIKSWLKRDDLDAIIPDFIMLAETQINRDLALMTPLHHCLEALQVGNFVPSNNYPFLLPLPARFKAVKRFQININGNFSSLLYEPSQIINNYNYKGLPLYFTVNGGSLEIAPSPNIAYSYRLEYYAGLQPLALGDNWIILNAPDIYLYASLIHAGTYLKDDARVNTSMVAYQSLIKNLEGENMRNRQANTTLQIRF